MSDGERERMEEKRVSTDGYAYTRAEFLAHFGGAHEWNSAPVETRYDRDGNTYTQAAFFAHYGGLNEWRVARPANANVGQASSSSSFSALPSSYTALPSVDQVAPGWSSDRGPTAPDDGFFDTRGYQEQFHSYDDMAYSPQVYGHWSAAAPASTSASSSQYRQYNLGNMSERSDVSQNSHDYSQSSYHDATSVPPSFPKPSSSKIMPQQARRIVRPGTSTSVTRRRDPPLRGRHPMYRNGNSRHHGGLGGGRYAASAAPSAASFTRSQSTNAIGTGVRDDGSTNVYGHTIRSRNTSHADGHHIERSLSSLGRKLFSHIPPNKNKHFFPPDSPKSGRYTSKSSHRRKSAGEQLGALTPKNGRSPDRSRKDGSSGGDTIDIGDYISVRCTVSDRFRLCRVLDLRDGEPPTVHVHFEGTPVVPDELIRFDSNRLAPFDAQQSPANGEGATSSEKITVGNSKKVSVGDFAEVRIFYQDPSTKKGDFRWQMAQIVSLDSNDGSIRVHFEGLSDANIGDEIIPGPDVPLRVRAMSTGIPSPTNSPKRGGVGSTGTKKRTGRKNNGDETHCRKDVKGVDHYDAANGDTLRTPHTSGSSDNQCESDLDGTSSSDDSADGNGNKNTKKMRESKSDIAKELRKCGLRVIKIAADGNCLFRAVCHQVYADVSRHLELRRRCCDYMASQVGHFSAFVEGEFDDYLEGMRDAMTWGGNLEIEALQEMFDRKIQIHSNDDRGGYEPTVMGGARNQSKPIPKLADSKSAPNLLPSLSKSSGTASGSAAAGAADADANDVSDNGGGGASLKKMHSSSSMAALAKPDLSSKTPSTVPSVKVPVVLKHDFSSSADSATPRPTSERVPEPIMLSYHGRSHYNSVVNPKHPPPLQPLGTSYIRQGRILREQQAKAKAKVAKASGLVKSQASGEGALADMLTPTAEMKQKKKNKRANRLAFFRFRKNKKSMDGGGDEVSAANQTSESRVAHKKTPAMLQPLGSEPDMNKLMSESSTALHNDIDGGNSQSVLRARQERQRPSLPSLQTGTGEEAAMQRANQVLRAAQFHEEHLQSQGL